MPLLRTLLLSILLCTPAMGALAQDTASQRSLQQEMTADEFKAAGLDKLSTQELAALNGWLDRKIDVETGKAAAQAKQKVETENRGFFSFGKQDPIVSAINGSFRGFQRGRNYVLANGQEWEQIDDAALVGVRKDNPAVKITPSLVGNTWYLAIDGYNTRAKVRRVK